MKKIILVLMIATMSLFLTACGNDEENENTDFIYELKTLSSQIGGDPLIEGYEITSYLGTEEDVEIPSFIGDIEVISIASNTFKDNDTVLSITIPETVKLISSYAFKNATNLENIYISENNTYYFDFEGSIYSNVDPDNIKLVIVPEGKTGNFNLYYETYEILNYAFQSCIKLDSITVTNVDDIWRIGSLSYSIDLELEAIYVPEIKLEYYKNLISFYNSYLEDLIVITE